MHTVLRARHVLAALAAPIGGTVAFCASAKSAWPDMVLPANPSVHADGSVDVILNYQQPHVELVQTRRDAGGSDDALHGADWDAHAVTMRDGRREAKPLTLDANGFELRQEPTASHHNFYDEKAVVGPYYRECEALLRRVTGARFVAAFDHNVRCDAAKAAGRKLEGGNLVQAPAGLVHGDYTRDSAPRRFALLGEPPKLNDALRGVLGDRPLIDKALVDEALSGERRYAFINVCCIEASLGAPCCRPTAPVHALLTAACVYRYGGRSLRWSRSRSRAPTRRLSPVMISSSSRLSMPIASGRTTLQSTVNATGRTLLTIPSTEPSDQDDCVGRTFRASKPPLA